MSVANKENTESPVATSREHAEQLLFAIGRGQRQIRAIEVRMNDELAAIRQRYEAEAQPINAQLEADFSALAGWAEENKGELLEGEAKTVKLSTGELSWRLSPPSVRVVKPDEVIARLRELKLERFIREVYEQEVDKDCVLREPRAVAGVKGITIQQKEEFVAKPFESSIEKARASATKKKVRHG